MPVLAYLFAIAIWSTTPLAIKLSNDSVTPITAISLRMILAITVGVVILSITRRFTVFDRRYFKLYFAGSIGIFPNMVLIYYAANILSSGLIAVLMGLSPFVTGLLAHFVLGEEFFTRRKLLAQLIAIVGLVTVFFGQLSVDSSSAWGVLLMLCSVLLFSVSSVMVKRFSLERSPTSLDQTIGAMTFSMPGLLLVWFLFDGDFNIELSAISFWSISYLALVGSLIGFVLFFYVLKQMSVAMVALILLITPAFALVLGHLAAGEVVSSSIIIGSALILVGLVLYENLFGLLFLSSGKGRC